MEESQHIRWRKHVAELKDTGLFGEIPWDPNKGDWERRHLDLRLPGFINRKIFALYLLDFQKIIITIESPFYRDRWYKLGGRGSEDLHTWHAKELTFEEILDSLSENLQTKLLFHLDLFR